MANVFPAASREDLSVTWTNSLTVDSQAQGIAPDGTNTMNRVIDNGDTLTGVMYMRHDLVHPTHDQYTFAMFFESAVLSQVAIQNVGFDNQDSSNFDLIAKTAVKGVNHDAAAIVNYGNGLFRCSITFTTTTDKNGHYRIYPGEILPSLNVERDGTKDILMWGASLNTGAEAEPYTSQFGTLIEPLVLGGRTGPSLAFGGMGKMGAQLNRRMKWQVV